MKNSHFYFQSFRSKADHPNLSPRPGTSRSHPEETDDKSKKGEERNEDQGRVSTPEISNVISEFYQQQGKTDDRNKMDESLHLQLSSDEE